MNPIKSNLEPIEEKDLNLKDKIKEIDFSVTVEKPVFKKENEPAREVSASEKDDAYSKIISKLSSSGSSPSDDLVSDDARDVSLKTDAESQIQQLVDLATTKGVFHAVKVARHIEDNYVLDTFHDRLLADEFHRALVEKGLLDEM